MPDRRTHRGAHPEDGREFAAAWHARLRAATADLSWLLGRGYSDVAALKLVGDRLQLSQRQRRAVLRCAAPAAAVEARRQRRRFPSHMRGSSVALDTFNCLITLEAILGGALVLRGRDGALRDLCSVHGTYRRVAETVRALTLIERALSGLEIARARFYLDRPVGNSGRLRAMLEERFASAPYAVEVMLRDRVDRQLAEEDAIVMSSDSWILDHARAWFDLPAHVVEMGTPLPFCVDLREE